MRHRPQKSGLLFQVLPRKLRLMLPLVAVCGLGLAQSALAQVRHTPWEMHEGQDVIKLNAELPSNGALPENGYIAFQHADIPVEGRGWVPAPNPDTIGFGGPKASRIGAAGGTCRKAIDYTYFQTFVEIPAGTKVDEFKIVFQGMDDASRITIFNSAHPEGKVVEGSYVTRASADTSSATTDLKALVMSGKNRVVITQVDWCPVGNQLQSAQVHLNGSNVAVLPPDKPGPLTHGAAAQANENEKLCSPPTEGSLEVEFINNSSQPINFHWMEFDCSEGGGPSLAPGQREKGITRPGHIFLARGLSGQILDIFKTSDDKLTFVVVDRLIAKVAEQGEPYTEGSCSPKTNGRFTAEFVNLLNEPITMQ